MNIRDLIEPSTKINIIIVNLTVNWGVIHIYNKLIDSLISGIYLDVDLGWMIVL